MWYSLRTFSSLPSEALDLTLAYFSLITLYTTNENHLSHFLLLHEVLFRFHVNECFALMHVCVSCASWNWSYAQRTLGIEPRSSVRTSAVHCWAISLTLTIPFLIFQNIDVLLPVSLQTPTLFYDSFTGTSPRRIGHLCFDVLLTFLPL